MPRRIPPPHPDPHPPRRFTPPPGACDAHCHVFGPAHRFPFAPDRTYTPPDAGVEDLRRLQQRVGITHAVLVQASCHGTDNTAMLDALERGRGHYAGVAMIDERTSDDELDRLDRAGVRGARFNFVRHLGGAPDLDRFRRLVDRVVPLGWHVVLHLDANAVVAHRDLLDRLPTTYIIDHLARVDAARGIDQPPFRALLELLRNERCWVKISGAERITAEGLPPYDDVVPFAHAVMEAAPDRVLWGTDWPHPNVRHMPDDGDLVDLLVDLVPDPDLRRRVLVDNPRRLYDLSAESGPVPPAG